MKLFERQALTQVYLLVVVTLLLLALPLFVKGYWLRVITSSFMYATMAQSLNIIAGYTGYQALGNSVFWGIGAYILAAAMSAWGLSFFPALALSGLGCAALAFLVGLPILRLAGRYFLMTTIVLLWLTQQVVLSFGIVGGSKGVTLPILSGSPTFVYNFFYYAMLAIMVMCLATIIFIERSSFGFALKAIRFDEEAAKVMGVNTTVYKTIAWTISAFFTGLSGGVFAYWMTYIDPFTVFNLAVTVKMYLMYLFGGAGTIWGPIVGAFFIEVTSELIWGRFLELHYFVLGGIIFLVAMLLPKGLSGALRIPFVARGAK